MWASERRNRGNAGLVRPRKNDALLGRTMQLRGDSKKSNSSRDGKRAGKYLLDYCWTFVCK